MRGAEEERKKGQGIGGERDNKKEMKVDRKEKKIRREEGNGRGEKWELNF